MNRDEQRDRDAETQDPPTCREQRHVHVVEHEDLIAQHREAIEILGTLLMRDRRNRREQRRDVRLERDRHLVAEAALHARADGLRGTRSRWRTRRAPAAATRTRLQSPCSTPSPSSLNQSASSASGSAASSASVNAATISAGSWLVAELAQPPHRRERRRQGVALRGVVRRGRHSCLPFLVFAAEALRLQIEHRPVAAVERHQLVVRAELDDLAVLEHADPIGVAHGREAVRDQDGRAVPRRGQEALEDLRLAAHVELRGRLVEQHDAGAHRHRAERARQRDALPLAAREIGAALVAARQNGVEAREVRGARGVERLEHDVVGRSAGRDVVAQRQLEADEVLEHRGQARSPRDQIELAQVDAVDFDRAVLRVVQPAQQLGQRRLAGAVLPDDRQRRTGGNREVEAVEHRGAAGIGKRHVAEADLACRQAVGRSSSGGELAGGRHRRLQTPDGSHRRRSAVQRPVEPAECDQRRADRALRVDRPARRGRCGRPRPPTPAPRAR